MDRGPVPPCHGHAPRPLRPAGGGADTSCGGSTLGALRDLPSLLCCEPKVQRTASWDESRRHSRAKASVRREFLALA